jgi:hypothetical protein
MKRQPSKVTFEKRIKKYRKYLQYFGGFVFIAGFAIASYGALKGNGNLMWNGVGVAAVGAILVGQFEVLNYV